MLGGLFLNFSLWWEFNTKVKKFRSDNALELKFHDYFATNGVIHQFSCMERHEQNFVVERKHQHLLNVAKALLFQSRVPIQFSGDCILIAAILINSTPALILKTQSPYQLLYKKTVDYTFFCTFGSLCFAFTLASHRGKFHPRATACVFLGYSPGMKGYKLYDIAKKIYLYHVMIFMRMYFFFILSALQMGWWIPFSNAFFSCPEDKKC